MSDWRIAPEQIPGASRPAPVVHVARGPKLVFFPGESIINVLAADGKIYVVGGGGESYPACGGPPMSHSEDGHSADPTPAGVYVLGAQHRHVTTNWLRSCIPYGAPLRVSSDGEIEYQNDGRWLQATGLGGRFTSLMIRARELKKRRPLTLSEKLDVNEKARNAFYAGGVFLEMWSLNDFGKWAWNLTLDGAQTPFYVHTTPDNEAEDAIGAPVKLMNSHGCVHVRPSDRDEMIAKGYLRKGMTFEVRKYEEAGPP